MGTRNVCHFGIAYVLSVNLLRAIPKLKEVREQSDKVEVHWMIKKL
jgi:hypothetical protein